MWVGLGEACKGMCFSGVRVVDDVGGDASKEVQVGVDVMPLTAKLDEFVNGNDVAGDNASSKV